MKKVLSFVLVFAIVLGSCSLADTLAFTSKTGMYAPTTLTKENSTGSNASITVSANAGGHSMYYQVRKPNGVEASNYHNTKKTGTFSVSYKTDGYGESMGRYGYSYVLRVAHRKQCTCSGGSATVTVSFVP